MWRERNVPVKNNVAVSCCVIISTRAASAYIYQLLSWIWKESEVLLFSSMAFSWPRMRPAEARKTWTRGSFRIDADAHSPVGKATYTCMLKNNTEFTKEAVKEADFHIVKNTNNPFWDSVLWITVKKLVHIQNPHSQFIVNGRIKHL